MKTVLFRAAVAAVALLASGAHAQTAPGPVAMKGIRIAVVLPPALDVNPANAECGLTAAAIQNAIIGPVRSAGLTVSDQASAQPFALDTPGLYLVPVIATVREGTYGCSSWIGLRAQAAHTLTLPSTQQRAVYQILFWDSGTLLADSISSHPASVASAVSNLASAFATEWSAEQR